MDNLFEQIISLENLFLAWKEFRRGKRKKRDVQEFERHLEDNLFNLHLQLENRNYRHGAYDSFYITDPKQRNIHKAQVRDRIVHHAIYRVLYPIFDPTFIYDSYSCRIGKGTHKAVDRLNSFIRRVSKNFTSPCLVLKCDIKKFFSSVDHNILEAIIRRKIDDPDTISLLKEIIGSFGSATEIQQQLFDLQDANRESFDKLRIKERVLWLILGSGIPIGNLTSQLFANLYMNEFDQYVKHELKVKDYCRYTDDFVIVSDSREYLENLLPKIELFLKNKLKLKLHPEKASIRKYQRGADFLGYVVLPHYIVLRTKTKKRMLRKINDKNRQSYLGLLKHCKGYKLKEHILWIPNRVQDDN